jgi:hypothetical protein
VTERVVVAVGLKPAAGTTYFKPAERGESAGVMWFKGVVPALPRKLVGTLVQRRQQAGLFGVANQFKTLVVPL